MKLFLTIIWYFPSCFLYPVHLFCILYPVSLYCILHLCPASCILYHTSCSPCFVSVPCILYPVSIIHCKLFRYTRNPTPVSSSLLDLVKIKLENFAIYTLLLLLPYSLPTFLPSDLLSINYLTIYKVYLAWINKGCQRKTFRSNKGTGRPRKKRYHI